jgi:putative redox protein
MVQIDVRYEGQLRCTAKHGPSGAVLNTDAPRDNMGKGEAFSPTDLAATALATCMVTTMGIAAQRHNINLEGTTASVTKEMATTPFRRIARLTVQITVPTQLSDDDRQRMRNAALSCPVHKSLHPDVKTAVTFYWGRERREERLEQE